MPVPYKIGSTIRNPDYEQAWAKLCVANDTYNNLMNKSWDGSVNAFDISAARLELETARKTLDQIPEWILVWSDPK